MILLQEPRLAKPVPCPYLPDRTFTQEYFFAHKLDDEDFERYLSRGWRRFGLYFFRPRCEGCRACRPLRISTDNLELTKSQKKALKRNGDTKVVLRPLSYSEDIFKIYRRHSAKFGEEDRDRESFRDSYFKPAVPAFQSEYYIDGTMAGIGFLDMGSSGLSSVYFAYDPRFSRNSLGTYSVIAEAGLARENGLPWYYLGYFIPECERMVYKGKFQVHQLFDWETESWS